MKSIHMATAVLAASLCVPAAAQDVGDWVLAPWRDSAMKFPGIVVARGGNSVTIRFDDGTTETRIASEVSPYNWRVGSRIQCRWSDGNWYNATIQQMGNGGYSLQVRYDDDGVVENTKTGRCRTRG